MQAESGLKDSYATPPWLKRVPMITGVLAGLAGFLTVRSANMSNQAIYNSNQAVLHQAVSSDHWAEYQADSIKRHIDETALLSSNNASPETKKSLAAQSKQMLDRQGPARDQASAEALLRDRELENGAQKLALKDLLDYAGVAAQLGIALASVAALTKKRAAFNFGVSAGVIAIAITGFALIKPYLANLLGHH